MMSHSNIPVYESVITVTRTTVAVQALQILNISFYCTLFCFYSQPVDHPLRTLLLARTRARTPNLLSCPPWLICTRAAVALKPDTKTPSTSFKLWTAIEYSSSNRIQLEFSKASMNVKRASSAALLAINRPYVSSNYYCCKSSNSSIFLGRGKTVCDWTPPNHRTDAGRLWTSTSTADLRKVYYNCKLH